MNPSFSSCPKKFEARDLSVINAYRDLSKRKAIPNHKQYISLLGPLSGHGFEEPLHVAARGLAHLSQIVGIERNADTHESNQKTNRAHYQDTLDLHQGDVVTVLERLSREGRLSPAIVNLDMMQDHQTTLPVLLRVFSILEDSPGPIMVVWNAMLSHKVYTQINPERLKHAVADPRLTSALHEYGWQIRGYHEYAGTGSKSATTMGTVVFWRA